MVGPVERAWSRWAVPALVPVLTYSLFSLAGPLSAGRWWLVAALVGRLLLGVVVLVAVRGRRQVDPRWAVAYLLLVLVTAVLNRSYDVFLILVAGLALVVVSAAGVVGLAGRAGGAARAVRGRWTARGGRQRLG